MFCSNCGNELRQGLKYCNRCGVIIAAEMERSSVSSTKGNAAQVLSGAVGGIGVFGIIGLGILIGRILRLDDIKPPHVFLVILFAVFIFAVIFLLVRQISKLTDKIHLLGANETEPFTRASFQRAGNTAQLESFREPIGSVTEHTTRTFDEALLKKSEN